MRRAYFDENDAESAAGKEKEPAETSEQRFVVEAAKKKKEDANSDEDPESGVKQDGDCVRDIGGWKGVEINGSDGQNKNA